MKLLFCFLVVNASPTEIGDFKWCTAKQSRLRYKDCVDIINEFKQECYELNAQPLPDGNQHKEWVNKKWVSHPK